MTIYIIFCIELLGSIL